jgi:hypothetical protein
MPGRSAVFSGFDAMITGAHGKAAVLVAMKARLCPAHFIYFLFFLDKGK